MKETTYPLKTVLCIEDDAGILEGLVNTLRYYFKEVYSARDGEEGVQLWEEKRPDLVLCDIQMPKRNGIEVAKHIRKTDRATPIVMLTAYTSERYLIELINLNIQHFIQKPASIDRLLEGIKAAFVGESSGTFTLGEEVFLDVEKETLTCKGNTIFLSHKESRFLALLATHDLVTYAMMETQLWQGDVSEAARKSFIRDLRKKLPEGVVENVSKRGFRLGVFIEAK